MSKLNNLVGNKYGRLTIISCHYEVSKNSHKNIHMSVCVCECGKTITTRTTRLISGITKSCRCLSTELTVARNKTHGDADSVEYGIWCGIKNRCTNKNVKSYKDYGERGITICDRWLVYENFLADMGRRPKGCSIDRINNEGNYEPDNCKWSTRSEQQNNKRTNHIIEYNGERLNIKQWCTKLNLQYSTILRRCTLPGWTAEQILTTPSGKPKEVLR